MAKQTGLYGIRGKVGEYKYYGMKGVDGTIMAKQNDGMSERVKTDPAYDNTRRNNFEFGMATSNSGAISKAFSQKWRYLLVPFATAKLSKLLLAAAKETSINGWGDRVVSSEVLNPMLPVAMQKFVKNDIQDFSAIAVSLVTDEDETTITVTADDLNNAKAAAAGCDGVRVVLCSSDITPASGGYQDKVISPASCEVQELATADITFGGDLSLTGAHTFTAAAGVVSVILLPYRTIGDEKYIMQEYCSAKFASIVAE